MKSLSYSLVTVGLVFSAHAALAQTTAYERLLDHRNKNEWAASTQQTPSAPRKSHSIELGSQGTQLVEFLYDIGATHVDETTTSQDTMEITANFPIWHVVTSKNGALLVHTRAKVIVTGHGDQQSFKHEQPELIYTTTKPEQNISRSDAEAFAATMGINLPNAEKFESERRNIQGEIYLYFRSNPLIQP